MLDRGGDVGRRGVDDEDAPRGGGGDVHVVHADTRAPHDRQPRRGLEQLPIHLRGAADEQGVRVLQLLEQPLARLPFQLHDLVPGPAKNIQPGRRDLVRHDDAAHVLSIVFMNRL